MSETDALEALAALAEVIHIGDLDCEIPEEHGAQAAALLRDQGWQLTRVGDEERLRALDVDRLAVAMNDAQIDPQEIRLGRDLGVVASRIAQKYDAALAATVRDDERLRGMRPVLVADDLLERWGTRTERGERITAEWGDPDERGWYNPTFSVHADDRLCADDEEEDALRGPNLIGPGPCDEIIRRLLATLAAERRAAAAEPLRGALATVEQIMDAEHRYCVEAEGEWALSHDVERHRRQAAFVRAALEATAPSTPEPALDVRSFTLDLRRAVSSLPERYGGFGLVRRTEVDAAIVTTVQRWDAALEAAVRT